jgi:glutamyl-tRNA synthetase
LLSPHLGRLDIDPSTGPELVEVVKAQQERAKTLVEMAETSQYFYRDFEDFDETAAKKNLRPVARQPLEAIRKSLHDLEVWTPESLHQCVDQTAASLELKMGKVAQPLRVAVTGKAASPGIDITLYLVGKDACLRRIDKALDYITKREQQG